MFTYRVTVSTGTSEYSGTNNYIYVVLVGEHGCSERTLLDRPGLDFCRAAVDDYEVVCKEDLGQLHFVQLEKQRFWVEDNWFCRHVSVECPNGQTFHFPCQSWFIGDVVISIPEGSGKKVCNGDPVFDHHRKKELQERQAIYRWMTWQPKIPRCIDAQSPKDLPQDVQFDNTKRSDFENSLQYALIELSLKKLVTKLSTSWLDLEDFKSIFWGVKSPVAEYVMNHWKEDWFFGYQFLNGPNPLLIRSCTKIPDKLRISEDMVVPFLKGGTSLQEEIEKRRIFLVDFSILDSIPTNVIQGKKQYLCAPICLLHQNPDGNLMPIAIQLNQTPGEGNPVFLPSDPELDWLLAKMWVRSADFQIYQISSHLLRTHLIAEVLCVATLRQLPSLHPIFKLLMPHMRYTLEINTRARGQLISKNGIFDQVVSTGGEGFLQVAQREYVKLTYESLCLPEDVCSRGVEGIQDYFYMQDGLRLWGIVQRFVSSIVDRFYDGDLQVTSDTELQAWITEICEEGFPSAPKLGLPSSFQSKGELVTFLTMGIFTCSAQHAALNQGQFDWCAWVPNMPCSMRQPPPSTKGNVTMEYIMESLPDIRQSCIQMAITWHLGRRQPDMISLGYYEDQYFTEEEVKKMIQDFQVELEVLEQEIEERNQGLVLKYEYIKPSNVENSITI
ncbi:polyunsaturated fatty acid lipoxygenase ALOX12-like [Ambystoma mexicanum]|uniref:polyunsaturated fatty acid lipoxygenase ALOX12-like n=1 Tax=Ambystoma mexicanum TaxID=8296 RepID=UPI0037E8C7A1